MSSRILKLFGALYAFGLLLLRKCYIVLSASGTYVFVNPLLSSVGDQFILVTLPLGIDGNTPPYHVSFWYYRHGDHIGDFKLYERYKNGTELKRRVLWSFPAGKYTGKSFVQLCQCISRFHIKITKFGLFFL